MPLFNVDIQVAMTAYIRANSAEEALAIAKREFTEVGGELPEGYVSGDIEITGADFINVAAVTLSPAITFKGPYEDAIADEVA